MPTQTFSSPDSDVVWWAQSRTLPAAPKQKEEELPGKVAVKGGEQPHWQRNPRHLVVAS